MTAVLWTVTKCSLLER